MLVIIIYFTLMMVVSAETYITYVDDELGFYKVRDVTVPTNKFVYENRILTIDQGDAIIWENDAAKTSFTIVSEQNLWDDKIGYLRVGSKVNYKFDKPGKYTFYIKEHKSIRQTVTVNMVGMANTTITPTNTPINTPINPITINSTNTSTNIPINTSTNSSTTNSSTNIPINIVGIKFPIKISLTTVISMIVAVLSIIIMYKSRKK